jgi:hypothetical protein
MQLITAVVRPECLPAAVSPLRGATVLAPVGTGPA